MMDLGALGAAHTARETSSLPPSQALQPGATGKSLPRFLNSLFTHLTQQK